MFGGVKFELQARVELTDVEADLIKKYKVDKEVLLHRDVSIPFTGKVLQLNVTIGSLVAGQTFKCADIGEIMEYESNVKQSCELFWNCLAIMHSFGGSEVIEYGGDSSEVGKAATA
jgi:hypothetical protein